MKTIQKTEKIEYPRPSSLPGVETLVAEHSARRWRFFHETYTMATIFDASGGVSEWIYRRKIHRTEAGGLMLMEPGEIHANTKILPPSDFRALFIQGSLIERAAKELGMAVSRPHLSMAACSDPVLFQAFTRHFKRSLGITPGEYVRGLWLDSNNVLDKQLSHYQFLTGPR